MLHLFRSILDQILGMSSFVMFLVNLKLFASAVGYAAGLTSLGYNFVSSLRSNRNFFVVSLR